jgi:hypothetical protein
MSLLEPCLITAATPTKLLPYYHVRRLPTGMYAVAHWVPGTNVAHVDAETTSCMGAMRLAQDMEAAKRALEGWHA